MTKIYCLTLSALILLTSASFAADHPRKISVSGECSQMVAPDRGAITLTVEFQDQNLSKATQETAQSYQRLNQAIKKLKLADANIQTAEYSVFEVKEWQDKRHVSKGFKARMGLWISTSEINRIGEIIALASKEKVKNVGALSTFLSDEKQLQEETHCLEIAARNAHLKAKKLASALGSSVGEVLSVNESNRSIPFYPAQRMQKYSTRVMAMEADSAAPSIEAGEQKLSLTIEVTFALK